MIPPRELAAQLAGSIFDRIESDRSIIKQNIEAVIADGLLLAEAKGGGNAGGDNDLADKLHRLMQLLDRESVLLFGTPTSLYTALDALQDAYRRAHKP